MAYTIVIRSVLSWRSLNVIYISWYIFLLYSMHFYMNALILQDTCIGL